MDRSLGRDDGLFDVSYISGPSVYDATAPVDGATLRDVFRLYHAGGAWRARLTWQLYTPSSGGSPAKTGADWQKIAPFAATFSIMASLFLGPSAWQALNLHRFGLADFPLPAALDSIPSRLIFVMALVCGLVFIVAAIAKTWEVRAASRWPSARGRIVRSQEGFKLVQRNLREMPVSTRVAEIAYTFEAEGQPYQGTRFTLAERVPEADVPDVLARYPLHADVTVFYDAADPNVSTLDRATPAGLLLGSLKVLAVAVMAVAALMWLVTAAANVLTQSFPGIALPLIFLMGCGAFIMLGLFAVIQRRLTATRTWPSATGQVVRSEVQPFSLQRKRKKNAHRFRIETRTGYMPVVEYVYSVSGRQHRRSVQLDTEVAGSESYAASIAARYPVGKTVVVRYDPNDPSRAGLEFDNRWQYILLVLGSMMALAALNTAGVLGTPIFVGQ